MGIQDFFVTPVVLILLMLMAWLVRPKLTTSVTRKYFMLALWAKVVGAIAIGLIYQFYYHWGDTYSYFRDGSRVWNLLLSSPAQGFSLILHPLESTQELFDFKSRLFFGDDPPSFMVVRFVAFFNVLTLNTYTATALFFAAFSFSGSWMFYRSLVKLYPHLHRNLAIAILFVPSVVIWGSGIFKDTLTLAALMWLAWVAVEMIEIRRIGLLRIGIAVVMVLLIASIKPYILMCFLPPLIFWVFLKQTIQIKNVVLKALVGPFMLLVSIPIILFALQKAGESEKKYALENLSRTAQITAYDIRYWTGKDAGSGYELGELDGSWGSMLRVAPQAVNVALFRPYLWEVSNPLMLMSALESLGMLILVIPLVWKGQRTIRVLVSNPMVLSFLIFALVFAFAVGVSSYNFGTLVRYKIPLMPFLLVALFIIRDNGKHQHERISVN